MRLSDNSYIHPYCNLIGIRYTVIHDCLNQAIRYTKSCHVKVAICERLTSTLLWLLTDGDCDTWPDDLLSSSSLPSLSHCKHTTDRQWLAYTWHQRQNDETRRLNEAASLLCRHLKQSQAATIASKQHRPFIRSFEAQSTSRAGTQAQSTSRAGTQAQSMYKTNRATRHGCKTIQTKASMYNSHNTNQNGGM